MPAARLVAGLLVWSLGLAALFAASSGPSGVTNAVVAGLAVVHLLLGLLVARWWAVALPAVPGCLWIAWVVLFWDASDYPVDSDNDPITVAGIFGVAILAPSVATVAAGVGISRGVARARINRRSRLPL